MKLGAASIASFEEGTAEAEVAANLYGPLRDLARKRMQESKDALSAEKQAFSEEALEKNKKWLHSLMEGMEKE